MRIVGVSIPKIEVLVPAPRPSHSHPEGLEDRRSGGHWWKGSFLASQLVFEPTSSIGLWYSEVDGSVFFVANSLFELELEVSTMYQKGWGWHGGGRVK